MELGKGKAREKKRGGKGGEEKEQGHGSRHGTWNRGKGEEGDGEEHGQERKGNGKGAVAVMGSQFIGQPTSRQVTKQSISRQLAPLANCVWSSLALSRGGCS